MSTRRKRNSFPSYISTGHLPTPTVIKKLVTEAYKQFESDRQGQNSGVYPALARVPSRLFGICIADTAGEVYSAGDAEYEFTIMSVSKPFIFALVCQEIGVQQAREKLGVNATGRAFNSLEGIERNTDGRTNPMVNSGAIATTSLVPGSNLKAKWKFIHDGLSGFAGRKLPLNDEVYASASASNFRNQSIARMLQSYGRIYMDPADAAELYETSGDWLYDIGLPGKSGIGGGIVTVSPGKGGVGTFSPLLDDAGNSV